jgi:asparagine synthetase B (glutamine-hydrolysing)
LTRFARARAQPFQARGRAPAPATGASTLETLCFDTQEYEVSLRLPERLLMRLDCCSMASGVEARVPFLDRELVELVYRLPPALKLRRRETKLVLRRAVADMVPAWARAASRASARRSTSGLPGAWGTAAVSRARGRAALVL